MPGPLDDVLGQIDTATNEVAAKVAALRDQIKTGMSAAEVTAVKDKLTAVETRLKGIAADPADPVPTPP